MFSFISNSCRINHSVIKQKLEFSRNEGKKVLKKEFFVHFEVFFFDTREEERENRILKKRSIHQKKKHVFDDRDLLNFLYLFFSFFS